MVGSIAVQLQSQERLCPFVFRIGGGPNGWTTADLNVMAYSSEISLHTMRGIQLVIHFRLMSAKAEDFSWTGPPSTVYGGLLTLPRWHNSGREGLVS